MRSRGQRQSLNRAKIDLTAGVRKACYFLSNMLYKTRTAVSRLAKTILVMTMTCSTSTSAFHDNSQTWHVAHASGKLVSNCFNI